MATVMMMPLTTSTQRGGFSFVLFISWSFRASGFLAADSGPCANSYRGSIASDIFGKLPVSCVNSVCHLLVFIRLIHPQV